MTNTNTNQPTFQDEKGKLKKKRKKNNLKNRTLGQIFVVVWGLGIAIATGLNSTPIQWLERQGQTLFFKLKGREKPPDNIVIIAIDDFSLQQGIEDAKRSSSEQLFYLKGLHQFPWKREVYGTIVKKILDSGASSVAVDLIFDSPSIYGVEDDQKFHQVLEDYGGKITLAALYEEEQGNRLGDFIRVVKPHPNLNSSIQSIGTINYLLEADGRIHQFPNQYIKKLAKDQPDLAETLEFIGIFPSFPEAILKASLIPLQNENKNFLYFYGGANTFPYISFVDILTPEVWENTYQNGAFFQDKIVLIGPTSVISQDFHRTPTDEKMPGIEIHANAIASLTEEKAIVEGLKNPLWRGLFTFTAIMGTGIIYIWKRRWWNRLRISLIIVSIWIIVSYFCFIYGSLFLPMATPVIGVLIVGLIYGVYGALQEVFNWLELRKTFKHYASSPIVQEIIARQDDLQDLLQEKEQEILNRKLGGRYQIIKALSEGGFGKTYIAKDLQRPGEPECVVKKLQPMTDNPKHWELAQRMFVSEAKVLEQLGHHNQIPELLAYFDDGEEFYLIQELIEGEPLSKELQRFLDTSVDRVINILEELLPVLDFMHRQGVIHRDIKPPNVIRRKSDDKLVLIDFGTVKELSQQIVQELRLTEEQKKFTIAIGTKGYTPPEQLAGSPRYNSDIYALGMIGIQVLTLLHPSLIDKDPETDELLWQENVETDILPQFVAIINKMINRDFKKRYQNAKEVLKDLQEYKHNFGSSLLKKRQLNPIIKENHYNSVQGSSRELSTKIPSISDIPDAPTLIPENDFDLTDLPTQEYNEDPYLNNDPTLIPQNDLDLTNLPNKDYNEDEDFTDLPTIIPNEDQDLTDLPTAIPENMFTINQQNFTNKQDNN